MSLSERNTKPNKPPNKPLGALRQVPIRRATPPTRCRSCPVRPRMRPHPASQPLATNTTTTLARSSRVTMTASTRLSWQGKRSWPSIPPTGRRKTLFPSMTTTSKTFRSAISRSRLSIFTPQIANSSLRSNETAPSRRRTAKYSFGPFGIATTKAFAVRSERLTRDTARTSKR